MAQPDIAPDGLPVPRTWDRGGLQSLVTAGGELELRRLLESVRFPPRGSTAQRIAQYARGLDLFPAAEGPSDAAAVGQALGLPRGSVHDLLSVKRLSWSARSLRRRLVVACMPPDLEAVVFKLTTTNSNRSAFAIMTAHVIGPRWRILMAAQRVRLRQRDRKRYQLEAPVARQRLVEEVVQILTAMRLQTVIPVLSGDTAISLNLMKPLVESDGLTFLVEVEKTWNYGGIVDVGGLDVPGAPLLAGATMRELFRFEPDAPSVRAKDVLPTAFTQLLGITAVAVESDCCERFFIGRMSGDSGNELQGEAAHEDLMALGDRFGTQDRSGVADGYGLEAFRCPGDESFQRHCTILTLRDCFAAQAPQRSRRRTR